MKSVRAWALSEGISPRTAHNARARLGIGMSLAEGRLIMLTPIEWLQVKAEIKPRWKKLHDPDDTWETEEGKFPGGQKRSKRLIKRLQEFDNKMRRMNK